MLKQVICTRCQTHYQRDVKNAVCRADRESCPRCRCEGWAILPRREVERLVQANQPLVQWCINRCTSRLTALYRERLRDELASAGQLALFTAACRFNPSFIAPSTGRPVLFSTFATLSICRSLHSVIVDSVKERTYTDADSMGMVPSRYANGYDAVDARDEYERLMRVSGLTQQEHYAIHKRTMESDTTLTEVAEVLGVTKERARQVENAALGKLRGVSTEVC